MLTSSLSFLHSCTFSSSLFTIPTPNPNSSSSFVVEAKATTRREDRTARHVRIRKKVNSFIILSVIVLFLLRILVNGFLCFAWSTTSILTCFFHYLFVNYGSYTSFIWSTYCTWHEDHVVDTGNNLRKWMWLYCDIHIAFIWNLRRRHR